MTRERVVQEPPEPELPLHGFPIVELTPDSELVRVHGGERDAGWFSCEGGRFDLPAPRGTCYLGDALDVSLREALGSLARHGGVPVAEARLRAASVLRGISGRFAAVSQPDAASYGVTSELTSMAPYAVPQAWAAAFSAADLDGIRYTARFTPGGANAWAVFGPSGAHPLGEVVEVIPGIEACERAGLRVLPDVPASSAVTRLRPPGS